MKKIDNVVTFSQREERLYTFTMKAEDMLALCRVERFGEHTEGVNRKLDENHAVDIATAMLDPQILWLEPILGDLRGGLWQFHDNKLLYDDRCYISVDDGQHRLRALEVLNPAERERFTFTITATHNLPFERRLRIFRMQQERKSLDSRLDLAQRDRLDDWASPLDREAYKLAKEMNTSATSPLRGRILLDESIKRPYESRHRPEGINVKGLFVTLRSVICSRSPLHALSPAKRAEVVMTMVNLAADVWKDAWGSERHILTTARGINAVLSLITSSPNFRGAIGENFTQDSLRSGLELASTFDWSVKKNRNDSVKKIVERLNDSIGRAARTRIAAKAS